VIANRILFSITICPEIPVEVLLKFNKVKDITTDIEAVAKVIKTSDQLILSEDSKFVKRTNPLPENDTVNERSLYVVCDFNFY